MELVFEKFLETRSTTATAKVINEMGYRDRQNEPFKKQQVQCVLRNPVYTGKIKWNGNIYEGVHQPIIAETMFNEVQDVFDSKDLNRIKTSTPALLGKRIYCGVCGSRMTPSFALNHAKVKYYYYRCTGSKDTNKICKKSYFGFGVLEGRVTGILLSLSEEKHFIPLENKLLKHNTKIQTHIAEQKAALAQLETTLGDIKAKKDKYIDGLLSSQFSSKERDGINARLGEIEMEEKKLKGQIFKHQLNTTQTEEELVNITEIKKQFISYRSSFPFADTNSHRMELSKIINRMTCTKETLEIQFKLIPWKEDFAMKP